VESKYLSFFSAHRVSRHVGRDVTCLFFEFISFAARLLKLGVCLVSVFCFALFLLAYLTLHHVQSNIQDFKSVMMVEEGPVSNLSIGTVICAGVMMLLTILMSILM